MNRSLCNVCRSPLGEPLYRSASERSLTSLCRIQACATLVHACSACGHLQSDVIDDVEAFYDEEYDILVASEEEDQIYEVADGTTIYRTGHQVRTLIQKLPLTGTVNLLDYGCAKSSTIRTLSQERPNVVPHLFDVSERYIPFWRAFAQPGNWSIRSPKPEWSSRFDVVTSFFSLEHIPEPGDAIRTIVDLLKPDGTLYAIVPNVMTNIADLIVVDHCNHFTAPSITRLMNDSGLEVVEIDEHVHRGAYVVVARKPQAPADITRAQAPDLKPTLDAAQDIASFWQGAAARVRSFEEGLPAGERVAIYGAGFYGAFIASSLVDPDRIACHLDQNPFLQGSMFDGRPVLPPRDLPADIRTLLVGLNPGHSRRIIADIDALAARELDYFYL